MRKILLVVLAMSLMLSFGALAAFAQDDTEDTAAVPLLCGMYGVRGGFGLNGGGLAQLTVAAEVLGMEQADLTTALQGGQTLAAIAEEQGVELDALTTACTTAYEEQLAAAVEAGQFTQEEADALLVLRAARQDDFDTALFGQRVFGGRAAHLGSRGQMMNQSGFGFINGPQDMLAVAAEALGMEQADLTAALQDGQTLAAIAEDQGIELDTITAAFNAAHEARIAAAVEAGTLTEEQAAVIQAQHTAMQEAIISGEFTPGSMMFGGRGQQAGMFGGGRGSMFGGSRPSINQNQS